jgi:hypothetical protein
MLGFSPYRNRRFVDRRIQGRLISRVGLYWMLYHVLLWHALLICRYVQFRMGGISGQPPGPFAEQLWQLAIDYSPVLVCGLLTLPVVLIDMLLLSHRIAGPLVRLGEALRDLKDGRTVDRVALRREDLLAQFQQEFNEYLAWLRHRSAAGGTDAPDPSCRSGCSAGVAAPIAERRTPAPETADMEAWDKSTISASPPVCST